MIRRWQIAWAALVAVCFVLAVLAARWDGLSVHFIAFVVLGGRAAAKGATVHRRLPEARGRW